MNAQTEALPTYRLTTVFKTRADTDLYRDYDGINLTSTEECDATDYLVRLALAVLAGPNSFDSESSTLEGAEIASSPPPELHRLFVQW